MNTRAKGSEHGDFRKTIWLKLALVGMVWLVYWNSFQVPFQFDDWHVIQQNPSVREPGDIPSFFTDISTFSILPLTRDYRPVFLTSMALAWWVGSGSTLPFHLVSVFLHMCCVLLVYSIFRRTFPERGPPDSPGKIEWPAWIGAALFALHPLATEPVVYISSQSVVLSAVFYLVSFRLFLAVHAGSTGMGTKVSWLPRIGSYVAYGLALMSKPIAIALPLNLLTWDLLLATPPHRTSLLQRARKHLPYWVVSLGFILLRSVMVEGPFGGGPARSLIEHYLTQTRVLVWYYLGRALVPLGLNVERDYPTSVSPIDPRFLLAVLVLAVLAWLLYRFRHRRAIVFWSAWFPICLLLTTYGVVLQQVVSEHRVYLSLVGFCAVVALLLARLRFVLEERGYLRHGTLARVTVVVPVVLLMLFYGYQAHSRNAVWSSDFSLWENSVAHSGTWRSHMNYALALERNQRPDEALVHFQRAVELAPYAFPHTNLGLAYVRRGDNEKGLEHLEIAVELRPDNADTHRYLARGLVSIGQLDEAEAEFRRAIALRPRYINAYSELADLYVQREQYDAAAEAYRQILQIDPAMRWAEDDLRAVEALARDAASSPYPEQEIEQGRYQEALEILERNYGENPTDPRALFGLGFSNQMLGHRERSAQAYEDLLEISPDHRQGTFNLAYLYLEGEDESEWSRSVELFERVLEIDPDYVEVLFHLGTAHRLLGNTERAAEYDREHIERGVHENLIEHSRERLGMN